MTIYDKLDRIAEGLYTKANATCSRTVSRAAMAEYTDVRTCIAVLHHYGITQDNEYPALIYEVK